ncbi:hypothetical protein, partial [Mediterraneibacter gnavus]|uniref:hypothetical protein n=1 Tax=Mediterraneibacter gnavus TaxID=33038 RepID=UPI0034A11013
LTLIDPFYDRISKSAVFHRYLLLSMRTCTTLPASLRPLQDCVFLCAKHNIHFLWSIFYYKTNFVYTQHSQSLQLLSETLIEFHNQLLPGAHSAKEPYPRHYTLL